MCYWWCYISYSYQMLCEAMDNFYNKAGKLRKSMGLHEKEFAIEIQLEEGMGFLC